MNSALLTVYFFGCFCVGLAALGYLLVAYGRRPLVPEMLALHAAATLLVGCRLVLVVTQQPLDDYSAISYVESLIGRYALLLTMGLLFRRALEIPFGTGDRILIAAVLAAFALQHVTEFGPWPVLDEPGDVFEDAFSAVLILYLLGAALTTDKPLTPVARGLAILSLIMLPGIAFDLFFSDSTIFRFYPIHYAALGVFILWNARAPRPAGGPNPAWALTKRESEVATLVAQGWGNARIAESLHISTNTVKTHIRAILAKADVDSRHGLMAAILGSNHPKG